MCLCFAFIRDIHSTSLQFRVPWATIAKQHKVAQVLCGWPQWPCRNSLMLVRKHRSANPTKYLFFIFSFCFLQVFRKLLAVLAGRWCSFTYIFHSCLWNDVRNCRSISAVLPSALVAAYIKTSGKQEIPVDREGNYSAVPCSFSWDAARLSFPQGCCAAPGWLGVCLKQLSSIQLRGWGRRRLPCCW